MSGFQIYKNLGWLNSLTEEEANTIFSNCCGSPEWSRRMTEARPFGMLDELFRTAARIWYSLTPPEQVAALSVPNDEERPRSKAAQHSDSSVVFALAEHDPTTDNVGVGKQLAEAIGLYEQKFGFIFVLSSDDRSTAEMLAICRARLGNSVESEIRIASDEQNKIIEIKLSELLEQ